MLPMISQGQTLQGKSYSQLVEVILGYVQTLIAIIVGLTFLVFFYGLAQFMFKAGDTKAQTDGKNLMLWGTIALFVMFSFYGIINIFMVSLF